MLALVNGGTFDSATGGTFQSDTDGTFNSDIPGTFESDMGGTFKVLQSRKTFPKTFKKHMIYFNVKNIWKKINNESPEKIWAFV